MPENSLTSNSYPIITLCDVLRDFNAQFLDEKLCAEYISKKLHPEGPRCPHCSTNITDSTNLKNFFALKRCQCKSCNHWFTATTNTFLQGSQFDSSEIIMLLVLLAHHVSVNVIAITLSVHPDTVRLWQKKIETLTGDNNE